jgi:hypothetical protein
MHDGLGYIREAIAKDGNNAKVEVVRWEKDAKTGYYSRPFKVIVKADIALKELEKPILKRSRVWSFIRPLGMSMDGNISAPQGSNRLNNPDLIEQLTAKIRAELKAEMEAEKPKRKKKADDSIEPTIIEEGFNDDLNTL